MAIGDVFGLQKPKGGAYSLQSAARGVLDGQNEDPNLLPTNPFGEIAPTSLAPAAVQSIQQANLPENYQFTGEFDAANRALQQQESDAGFKRTQTLQQIAEAFLRANQSASEDKSKARTQLLESLGSRGLGDSGVTVTKSSELETNYQKYLDDLARARASDVAGVENSYASILNNVGRQREGLFSAQQKAEEARKLEEERIRAEAVRQQQEAEARRAQLEMIAAAQEQARAAMQQATAAAQVSYSPVAIGGGGYSPSTPSAPAAPTQERIVLPFLNATSNVPGATVQNWVKKNVDPNLSGESLNAVIYALQSAGQAGMDRNALARVIQQASIPRARAGSFAGINVSAGGLRR